MRSALGHKMGDQGRVDGALQENTQSNETWPDRSYIMHRTMYVQFGKKLNSRKKGSIRAQLRKKSKVRKEAYPLVEILVEL